MHSAALARLPSLDLIPAATPLAHLPRLPHHLNHDVANQVIFIDHGVTIEQGEAKALFSAPREERPGSSQHVSR